MRDHESGPRRGHIIAPVLQGGQSLADQARTPDLTGRSWRRWGAEMRIQAQPRNERRDGAHGGEQIEGRIPPIPDDDEVAVGSHRGDRDGRGESVGGPRW